MALSLAAPEVISINILPEYVGLADSGVVFLNEDNQIALQMVQEDSLTDASKHVSIYYHLIREKV